MFENELSKLQTQLVQAGVNEFDDLATRYYFFGTLIPNFQEFDIFFEKNGVIYHKETLPGWN
ncbi:hypothetical protein EQG49_04300 [Periweissella cryptocerci]|uniref:Uncharacterized protein n=1 Tax=Periweissella cryptocerci TaxID=2506420 RepID=A0A4P6YSU6_9LACO|nr:hypothetical protein [Periweissella cryptocerci]QBO35736.1 hypothetical protein EQG49_04300 [Periweissella cryptocerci]